MPKKNKQAIKRATPVKTKKATGKGSKKASSGGSATQTILNVTAMLARLSQSNEISREKMVAFVKVEGVTGGSTLRGALAKLKNAGSIVATPTTITITEKGLSQADSSGDLSFSTNQEYQKKIQEQMKVKPKARELTAELADGRVRNKEEVAAALGMKMNSTWRSILAPLKKLDILDYGKDTIWLADNMFPFGRPEAK